MFYLSGDGSESFEKTARFVKDDGIGRGCSLGKEKRRLLARINYVIQWQIF